MRLKVKLIIAECTAIKRKWCLNRIKITVCKDYQVEVIKENKVRRNIWVH